MLKKSLTKPKNHAKNLYLVIISFRHFIEQMLCIYNLAILKRHHKKYSKKIKILI